MFRFLKFCAVGWSGAVVHFAVLYGLTEYAHIFYVISAALAVICAATNNYVWNHKWTFSDAKSRNSNIFAGWLKYLVSISITELLYLGLLAFLTEILGLWYILSACSAIAITSVIRYVTVAKWVWHVNVVSLRKGGIRVIRKRVGSTHDA